jgi:hypothetical protein
MWNKLRAPHFTTTPLCYGKFASSPIGLSPNIPKQGVCHIMALPFTLKSIVLMQKKKNYGNSNIFHHAKMYNLQKNRLQETKILQDIITLITNLKFQLHKPKISFLSKILIWK